MNLITFSDGSSTTNFVASKKNYKTKEDFLKDCLGEFDYEISALKEKGVRMPTVDDVYEDYCRYYPKMPQDYSYLELEGGYVFTEKRKGAFEVYAIDLRYLAKTSQTA